MADDLTISETMSGYELAKAVLEDPSGGIEALLELSGNGESDWLELKAGMNLLPEDKKKGHEQCDLYWHIGTAVLELMNTSGGALIIGIEDKTHDVVPLCEIDSGQEVNEKRMETYLREGILDHIWPKSKTWKISTREAQQQTRGVSPHWSIHDAIPENLLDIRGCQYRNKTIAVILIKPASPAIRVWKNDEIEQIRARKLGEIGCLLEVKGGRQMDLYDQNRSIKTDTYASLYRRFLAKKESESEAAKLNGKIEDYYKLVEKEIKDRRIFDLSCFTSLDASGGLAAEAPEDDFMEPQAVELIEDDSWLDDDDEDNLKKHNFENDDAEGGLNEDEEDEEKNISRYREKRSGDLLQLMHEIPRIAIIGEPGGGKTTTLMRFAIQFHEPENKKQILAVFIRMGQWLNGGSLSILLEKTTKLAPAEWQKLIESKRLWLVIDAVNECPDSFRKAAIVNIQSFLRKYPDLPVAISARTDEDLRILQLPTFTVQPMDVTHQLNYLTSYLKDPEQAQSLQNRLQERAGGMEIAANPMLLRLVVEVYKSEGELPAGRADLYHRWIRKWYKREYGKAKEAGEPLPWDFDRALEILSELAFQSRLQGYRDVPKDIVESILEKFGDDCIAKLCQGPVVTAEEDFIRFRHETFQEYLCAEYLIRHPDALPQLTREESAQWGMPLAYAAELRWPLPEQLWRAAWKIDPWFAFAVTDDSRLDEAKELASQKHNPFLRHVLSNFALTQGNDHLYSSKIMKSKYLGSWYIRTQKLGYVVLTNDVIRNRWFRMELELLRKEYSISFLCSILTRSIVLRSYAGHSIHQTFQNIMEAAGKDFAASSVEKHLQAIEEKILMDNSIVNATQLTREGFASKDDYKNRLPFWIQTVNISDAKYLIDAGLATGDDFKHRLPYWIQNAKIFNVGHLIKAGLATADDFKEQIDNLINQVKNPKEYLSLAQMGLVSKEDLEGFITTIKSKADPQNAKYLIDNGLATKDDFKDKIEQWKSDANPHIVNYIIRNGLAVKEDFKDIIEQWKRKAGPRMAALLIQHDLASKEDFERKVKQWKLNADPPMAVMLIQKGWAVKEDFEDKIKQWKLKADPQMVVMLIQNDLATKEDFEDIIEQWKSDADPQKAIFLIQNDLAVKEDFEDRIEQWKKNADPQVALMLIQKRWAVKEDFEDRIEQWKSEADPETVLFLIRNGLVSDKDFKDKIEQWKSDANPQIAIQLINCKMATREDFKEKSKQWGLNFAYLPYRTTFLRDPLSRQIIERDLQGKKWKMRIIYHDAFFSLFSGIAFPSTVFCLNYLLKNGPQTIGSVWSVEVSVSYNKKRKNFGFYVKRAEYIPTQGKEEKGLQKDTHVSSAPQPKAAHNKNHDTTSKKHGSAPPSKEARSKGHYNRNQTRESAPPSKGAAQSEQTQPARNGLISLGDIFKDVLS